MKSARNRGWARRRSSNSNRRKQTSERETRHPQFESLEPRWQPSGLPLPGSGLRVDNVHLVRDTGVPNDRVTVNATISGTVAGNPAGSPAGSVRVEFDHGGDGRADGSVNVITADGGFVYDPRGADLSLETYAGALNLRYRAVRQDGATQESTAWQTFSYQLLQPPAAAYIVTDVSHHASQSAPVGLWITGSLIDAGGALNFGNGSASGALGGGLASGGSGGAVNGYNGEADLTVSDPDWSQDDRFQPMSGPVLSVEFDENSDGRVDGRATAEGGRFEYRPEQLRSGWQTVRMRAAQWDTSLGMLLRGPWTDYVFQWSPTAPAIHELALANDTGPSNNDRRTWDPAVRGSLVSPFTNTGGVNVEWDVDGNGGAEGSQSVEDDGSFRFVPDGLTPGPVPLRVRTSSWEPISRETVTSSWVDFPYFFELIPLPQIASLKLFEDNGDSATDLVTSNSTIIGSVAGDVLQDVPVEWDRNNDGLADGTAMTDAEGAFRFTPTGLEPGPVTVRARVAAIDGRQTTQLNDWTSLTFVLTADSDSAPRVVDLELANDTGDSNSDGETTDPTIRGRVSDDRWDVAGMLIEFDHDGNGVVDGSVRADEQGGFTYRPEGLRPGKQRISARASAYNYSSQRAESSAWSSLEFVLGANVDTRPAIIDLGLLSDSGVSAEDGRTENTTIAGQVRNVSARWIVIQTDENGDGAADQSIRVNDDGSFRYEPRLSAFGPAQVGTRLVYWNSAALNWTASPWQSLNFVYEDQPDEAARLFDLAAGIADPINDAGRIRLTGRITNEASLADVAVEIDLDGDSQPDLYTRTEDDGRFSVLFAMSDAVAASDDGSLSLSIRTREWNDEQNGDQFGSWQAYAVSAIDVQPQPARIVTIGVGKAEGSTGVPCLRGTIDRDPLGESVVIEFDHNGDGRAEASVTVDSAREFEYVPQGLAKGNATLRARTRDYLAGRGWLRSDWQSVSLVVADAANSQLAIQSIELAHDDGASRQDRSTSDPTLRVRVANASGSSAIVIDFDYNQDRVADETVPLVAGELTHKPRQLLNGWVPLEVRARSEDGNATSDWQSFGFVYSGQPDGAEAQAWLAAAGRYNAELAAAQLARNNLVQTANADQATALSNAKADYEAAIQLAYAAERQSTDAANVQHDLEVAEADGKYLAAIQQANKAYLDAAKTDDGPRIALPRLEWPDSPATEVLPLPNDADQPVPPVSSFDDTGPGYDFEQDSAYQAATSQAESDLAEANKSAQNNRQHALDSAEDEYQQQLKDIQKVYDKGYQEASKAYASASQKAPATDLQAASETFRRETQFNQDNYDAAVETFVAAFKVVFDAARTTLESAQANAQSVYGKAREIAQQTYNKTVASIRPSDCNRLRQASIVLETAALEAAKTRDVSVSAARNAYDREIAPAVQKYRQQVAAANRTRREADSMAVRKYDEAKAQYDLNRKLIQIAAQVNWQKAKAGLVRERAWATADAAVVRDRRIALTERVFRFAVESAQHSQWLKISDARVQAIKAWHYSNPSPWTEYQLALAQSQATYTAARVKARDAYVTARIDATYRHSMRLADAVHTRSRGLATLDASQEAAHAEAKSDYWSQAATNQWKETLGRARNRQQLRDGFLKQQEVYARDAADSQLAFALAGTDAWHVYVTEQALARKWTPPANTCAGGMLPVGIGSQPTLGGIEQPGDIYAIGQNTLKKKLQAASHALQLSNIRREAALSATRRQVEQQYQSNMTAEETAKSQALAGDLRVYHEALARIDRQHAIDVVDVESIETSEKASQDFALVESVAALDQQFADADSKLIAVQRITDAESKGQFTVNAASVYAGTLAAWNEAQSTAWSEYHKTLGQIEVVHARAQAAAELAATKKTIAAEATRAAALTLAERQYSVEHAKGVKQLADATVSARKTASVASANAKRDYAYAVAGLDLRRADNSANQQNAAQARQVSYNSTHNATTADAETTFQIAMSDMWLVLMNAQADAEYTFTMTVTAADASWRGNKITTDAYKQAVSAADAVRIDTRHLAEDAFDASAKQAWNTLRAVRAAEVKDEILFRVQSHSIWLDQDQTSQYAYSGDLANAAKKLANSLKDNNIALATGLHQAELVLATTEAGLDQAYTVATTSAEATYTIAAESARLDETRNTYMADAAQREASISARGNYETALRGKQVSEADQSADLFGIGLANYQRDLASIGEQWSEQTRVARDAFEDDVTAITLKYLIIQNAADLAWISVTSTLDAEHSASQAMAEAARKSAEASASANLQITNAAIEANWTAKETIADIDYDAACAAAVKDLYKELVAGYGTWSTAIVAPSSQHYLDTTEDQVPFWAGQFTTTGPIATLGYLSSGTSVMVGSGIDDYRLVGGYVFSVPNLYPTSFQQLLASYTPWIGVPTDMKWQPPYGDINPWNNSREADNRYSQGMMAAWKTRNDGSQLAEVHYVTAIGNAQVARAGVLGDAAIQAAKDRGTAAIVETAAIDQAQSAFLRATAGLESQDQLQRAAAKKRHTLANAGLQTAQLRDQGAATVAWFTAQNALDLDLTRQAAVLEAQFQLTEAAAETFCAEQQLERPSTPFRSGAGSQTVAYPAALEQWVVLVAPDFIAHQVAIQQANGQRELQIERQRSARLVSQAAADEVYYGQSVQIENEFTLQSQSLDATNRLASATRESTSRQGYALAQQSYEMAVAQADKQYAIDLATAQKQYQIGRIGNPKDAARQRDGAVGDATLTRSKAIADGDLAWRTADAMVRQREALDAVGAESAYATGSAAINQQRQSRQAAAEALRQAAYARADEVFAQAELAANNQQRRDQAGADLTLWSEEAIDRIAAHATIDAKLDTNWSDFLHCVAQSQFDALSSLGPEYLAFVDGTNQAELDYTTTVSTARLQKDLAAAAADSQHADLLALAEQKEQVDSAKAQLQYVQQMVDPARTAAESLSRAQHDHDIAVAKAARDLRDHKDQAKYNQDVERADAALRTSQQAARSIFVAAESRASSTRDLASAKANYDKSIATIGADLAQQNSLDSQSRDFQRKESVAYLISAESHSKLDRTYLFATADSLATAMATLAQSHPSRWADLEAARSVAYRDWTHLVGNARQLDESIQARNRSGLELKMINQDYSLATNESSTSASTRTTAANADLNGIQSFARAVLAGGGSAIYQRSMPKLNAPSTIADDYSISKASDRPYFMRILVTESLGWHSVPYQPPFWNVVDAFNVFDAGLLPVGFGPSLSFGEPARVVLAEPAPPSLPAKFWQVAGELEQQQQLKATWISRYETIPDANYIQSKPGPTPDGGQSLMPTIVASVPRYEPRQIAQLLEVTDGQLAELFRKNAIVVREPQTARPRPLGAAPGIAHLGADLLPASISPRGSLEKIALTYPDDWDEEAFVAKAAALLGSTAASDNNDPPVRSPFRPDQVERLRAYSSLVAAQDGFDERRYEDAAKDKIIVQENGDVIWHSARFMTEWTVEASIDTVVGTASEGWVWLKSGGRATLTALQKVAGVNHRANDSARESAINSVKSPYQRDHGSNQIGIFIGGTGMHIFAQGNVERLYNLYQGTKFYYGGIANPVDYQAELLSKVTGWGWTDTLDRAEADIVREYRPGDKVHLFGFSRGAAMANELGKRLEARRISVDFLGLFDPVYSYGFVKPGQNSELVEGSWDGYQGNYVTAEMSSKVKAAAIIYAANEDRTWFPATRFLADNGTDLTTIRSPGGHGEIGGHWANNVGMQQLNLRTMIEYARGHGGVNLAFHGLDPEIKDILDSHYSLTLALEEGNAKPGEDTEKWLTACEAVNWAPFSATQFIDRLNTQVEGAWLPGGYDTQRLFAPNPVVVRNPWNMRSFLRGDSLRIQPYSSHYERDLSWVDLDVYSLFPNGAKDSSGQLHTVNPESIRFIQSLYERRIDPEGGWRPEPTLHLPESVPWVP